MMSSSEPETLDSITSSKTRLKRALRFLRRHPKEHQIIAAKIYSLHPKTINNAILRGPSKHGGQNKGLIAGQEQVVHGFIKTYLEHNFLPTRNVIFAVICNLRAHEGKKPLSQDWFTRWWKGQGLHKIKTKPIAVV